MKKTLNFIKTKILMFIFALVLPLSAAGTTLSLLDFANANADTNTTNFYTSYTSEKSLTNSNFNSGSSNYSISESITGWSGQVSDKKTTAGYINVGDTFQTYMSNTYHLSQNPGKASSDNKILMINSKTKDSADNFSAHQGYKSNSISLDANSFYSFQVAFKSDTNYNSYTDYVEKGTVTESNKNVSKANFTVESKAFATDDSKVYVAFSYDTNTTYYVEKKLTESYTLSDELNFTSIETFYSDENYVGYIDDSSNPVYIKKSDITESGSQKTVAAGTKVYTCNLAYNQTSKNFAISASEKYYKATTAYTSLNDYTYGSIYLSGLKDKDGKAVKAEYVKISSKEWQIFYFFVATGSESQTVTLDLWLGGQDANRLSSGVVFFDNCHVYQYSENAFWKAYKNYKNKKYTQEYLVGGELYTDTTKCSKLTDLTNNETLDTTGFNFDFEDGTYTGTSKPVSKWTKSGSGYARVFDVKTPEFFKSTTGYDFVGSDLSCVILDDEQVSIIENKYVLGLWAKDQTVKIKSSDIEIDSNKIYKIKANYKVSSLTSGSAYMFVSENDNVLTAYDITSDDYTLATETASSALSSNGSSDFNNSYNSVEFFVKGGSLYSSSINISLGLGKDTETATGCVVFDNITIEEATNTEYTNASNKIELGSTSKTNSVNNGTFNKTDLSNGTVAPYTPADWTLSKEEGKISFGGVINTAASEYEKYISLYEENKLNGLSDSENPYYFAKVNHSPKNFLNSTTAIDNVLMLSNVSSTWQKATGSSISIDSDSTKQISFYYNSTAKVNLTLTDSNGITVFEAKNICSNGTWKTYSIYLKSSNAETLTLTVGLGTADEKVSGVAYFDNFMLTTIDSSLFETKAASAASNEDLFGAVDMTDMYQNLPTNKIGTDVNINNAPAYSGSVSTGTAEANVGAIVKSEFFENGTAFHIDEDKNMFYLSNQGVGSYVIESKFPVTINGYYMLSFKVKTKFVTAESDLDSEKTYNYGVSVGLTNFDLFKNIRSDEDYQTYKVYFHTSESTEANLYISLVSDYTETCGTAVIYDLALETVEEDIYNQAKTTTESESYSANSDRVFVAKATETDEETDKEESSEEESSKSSLSDLDWSLIISGSITALAIILAVIFTVLRKIKIRKIEVKRKEEYDRKSTLELAVIKKKAEKEQAKEIKEVQTNIDRFTNELNSMEKDHKEKVVKLREQDQGKVSKQTDREFKDFARKRAAVAEKIETLEKQKQELQSPDHLLELERKIFAKEEYEKKNLEKSSKAKNKADEKKSK